MTSITGNLESISRRIRAAFTAKDEARERALPLCREVIRYSSDAIRSVHRQEFKQAEELLKSARDALKVVRQTVYAQGELMSTGFVSDAEKEFSEGSAVSWSLWIFRTQ